MLTPHIEHESPDMLQFDIDMFVGQSEYEGQSGKAQGSCTDDMLCDRSCIVIPGSITISDASWAETGLSGHINNTATRAHSADCVIRLITLKL